MRKPFELELIDAETREVVWYGPGYELREHNFDDTEVLDAIRVLENAYYVHRDIDRSMLPKIKVGGGAAPVFEIRAKV